MSEARYDPFGAIGLSRVASFIREQLRWIFRNQPEDDMGIDAHVEPCLPVAGSNRCNPTGRLLGLQIKAGPSWFAERHADGWYHRLSDTHFQYWSQHSLPVLVVLWDIEGEVGYWAHVRPEAIVSTGAGWKLLIPRAQPLDTSVCATWLEIAHANQPSPQATRRLIAAWNVPFRRNRFFTGRESVFQQLATSRASDHLAAVTDVLGGLGGLGKTQTVVEYAYRSRGQYAATLWLRAETEEELRSGFLDAARVLELPEKDAEDAGDAVAAVLAWLERNNDWLVVFDNADDAAILVPYLPQNASGHVIITSRARVFDSLGVATTVPLSQLPPEEARQFLLARTGRHDVGGDERAAVDDLARQLGYLPLALEQAGAYIAAKAVPFHDYLVSYERHCIDLLDQSQPVTGGYEQSVATTWSLNIAEVERRSVPAAELLRVSSFLAPDAIPIEFLTMGAAELGDNVSAFLSGVEEDPVQLYELMEPLTQYSLVQIDPDSRAYGIHRLVQEVVKASLSEGEKREWARRAIRALQETFPPASFPSWPLYDKLIPHAILGSGLVQHWDFTYDDAGGLLNEAASFLRIRADFAGSELMHSQTLALARAAVPLDESKVAVSLNNLAFVYVDQLRFGEAEPLLVEALRITEAKPGDHETLALACNNLAGLYVRMEQFGDAEPLIERAIDIWQPGDPEDEFFTGSLLNIRAEVNLGLSQLTASLEDAERALAIRQTVGNPEKTVRSYTTLGYVYFKLGRFEEADQMLLRAIQGRELIYGPQHPEWIVTLERRAELLKAIGRGDEAEALEARARKIRQAVRFGASNSPAA
jgi:tetratricopeptide (TPR) repeat protein